MVKEAMGTKLLRGYSFAYGFVWIWAFLGRSVVEQFVSHPVEYTKEVRARQRALDPRP